MLGFTLPNGETGAQKVSHIMYNIIIGYKEEKK